MNARSFAPAPAADRQRAARSVACAYLLQGTRVNAATEPIFPHLRAAFGTSGFLILLCLLFAVGAWRLFLFLAFVSYPRCLRVIQSRSSGACGIAGAWSRV